MHTHRSSTHVGYGAKNIHRKKGTNIKKQTSKKLKTFITCYKTTITTLYHKFIFTLSLAETLRDVGDKI